jgi:hypothetical protein
MGRSGSTTSPRARQMRHMLVRGQRSELTLREFGQQRGIPLSTLTWWRQVFRRAGEPVNPVCDSAADPAGNAGYCFSATIRQFKSAILAFSASVQAWPPF